MPADLTPVRERIAYHEAGHAVASVVVGFGCELVYVGRRRGRILCPNPVAGMRGWEEVAMRALIVFNAGWISEQKLLRERNDPTWPLVVPTGDDLEKITAHVEGLERVPGRKRVVEVSARHTLVLLCMFWASVRLVAHAARRFGHLDRDQVKEFIALASFDVLKSPPRDVARSQRWILSLLAERRQNPGAESAAVALLQSAAAADGPFVSCRAARCARRLLERRPKGGRHAGT